MRCFLFMEAQMGKILKSLRRKYQLIVSKNKVLRIFHYQNRLQFRSELVDGMGMTTALTENPQFFLFADCIRNSF